MDPLPTELWTNIVRYLRKPDWLNLAVTCRYTHMVAEAMIFRQVDLQNDLGTRILRLCRSIESRSELGGLVRTIKVAAGGPLHTGTRKLTTHPVFCQLALFSGLQSLELWGFSIDVDFFHALCALPPLQAIRIFGRGSKLIPDNMHKALEAAHRQVASVESLEIGRDPSYVNEFMSHFVLRDDKHLLRTLIIRGGQYSDTFAQLLMSAPQLQHLSLPGFTLDAQNPLPSIRSDAMPLLEKFSGPAKYCDLFIRGRPVHTLELDYTITMAVDALLALHASSTPVTSLTMNFATGVMDRPDLVSILQHMPTTVRHFGWTSYEPKAQLISWLPALSRLSNLQRVEGFLSYDEDDSLQAPLDAEHQNDVVLAMNEACPSLRHFTFLNYPNLLYVDVWKRWTDGHWERYTRYLEA